MGEYVCGRIREEVRKNTPVEKNDGSKLTTAKKTNIILERGESKDYFVTSVYVILTWRFARCRCCDGRFEEEEEEEGEGEKFR